MSVIHGTYRDGKIVLDAPADWPEGTRVAVERDEERIGISEEEQGDDPESIAAWIAWMNGLQPFVMTPEEEAVWQQAREQRKAWELAHWQEHSRKLRESLE